MAAKGRRSTHITFWEVVDDQTFTNEKGCEVFFGSKDGCGYGRICKEGELVRLHRARWEQHNGKIPSGLCVCHICDNTSCHNIEHLFLGTHAENMADKAKKGRADLRGERNPSHKISAKDIPSIRVRIKSGEACYGIAKEYGVTGEAILAIKHGKTWAIIP